MLHSSTAEDLLHHRSVECASRDDLTSTVESTEPLKCSDISGICQSSQRTEITQQPCGEAGPKMTGEEEMLWILTACGLLVKTSGIQFPRDGVCPTGWRFSTKVCGIIVLTTRVNLTRNQ